MLPLPAHVRTFLGAHETALGDDLLQEHIDAALVMVKSYTRDNGFTGDEPNADLAKVIVAFAGRSAVNPTNERAQQAGPFSRTPAVVGWSLPEIAVLNRYRRKAA